MQNTGADALSAMDLKHKDMAKQAEAISVGIANNAYVHLPHMTNNYSDRELRSILILKPVTGP